MKRVTNNGHNYLSKYLFEVRSQGRYTFTLDELRKQFDVSDMALNQSLARLKAKKEIAQIRQGFYAIIPPEYSKQGMLPPYLFIDDLMESLHKPYYVGLLSAAAIYGAAHQQPMEYYVIAETPAPRNINNKKLKITFLSKDDWSRAKGVVVQQKTDAGYINVSSPELTALDFFSYTNQFGINRIVSVLEELAEEITPVNLTKTAREYPNTAAIQRLGYILDDVIPQTRLSKALWTVLNERKYFPAPLSPQKEKKGEIDSKWKVIKNMEIESDL